MAVRIFLVDLHEAIKAVAIAKTIIDLIIIPVNCWAFIIQCFRLPVTGFQFPYPKIHSNGLQPIE
ncbi:MAG: hypothetical protein ACXWC7_14890 [Chitinophagaceae bacterium]